MNKPRTPTSTKHASVRYLNPVSLTWGILLLAWLVALCIVPDPRPLSAPKLSVKGLRYLVGIDEPAARFVATVALRGAGLGLIGILLSLSFRRISMRWAAPLVIVMAPLLAIAVQWINYGYFPISPQLRFGVASVILGALAGLVLRRSWIMLMVLVIFAGGLFAWGTSTGIPDDLYEAARTTGLYVLSNAEDVTEGDDGFAMLLQLAFTFAEDNSHGTDSVPPNQAAILALGVILGEKRVAKVAKRPIDLDRKKEIEALRKRVTLRGRRDLSQHFWVSAALAVLSDEERSITVGIAKEMMDATPGGSGFSFVDLMANRAGILFADAATRNPQSAHDMQLRIWNGVRIEDFCPDIRGLPEGISRDEFQAEYGGLGGVGTRKVVKEIQRRLATCEGLM
jgi:hypothetical protein